MESSTRKRKRNATRVIDIYSSKEIEKNTSEKWRKGFAKRLCEIMDARGLTLEDFAESVGLTKSSISTYIHATSIPKFDIIYKISKKYGVTIDYLIGNSDAPTHELDQICKRIGLSPSAVKKLEDAVNRKATIPDFYLSKLEWESDEYNLNHFMFEDINKNPQVWSKDQVINEMKKNEYRHKPSKFFFDTLNMLIEGDNNILDYIIAYLYAEENSNKYYVSISNRLNLKLGNSPFDYDEDTPYYDWFDSPALPYDKFHSFEFDLNEVIIKNLEIELREIRKSERIKAARKNHEIEEFIKTSNIIEKLKLKLNTRPNPYTGIENPPLPDDYLYKSQSPQKFRPVRKKLRQSDGLDKYQVSMFDKE